MAKKPGPPKPTSWTIYKLAAKQERLGTVEPAVDPQKIRHAPGFVFLADETRHPVAVGDTHRRRGGK
jgi:hypothetical protein